MSALIIDVCFELDPYYEKTKPLFSTSKNNFGSI